jgi:hypothetical protein
MVRQRMREHRITAERSQSLQIENLNNQQEDLLTEESLMSQSQH